MSPALGGGVVLPPVPPWRAWPLGGACAGAALGLAEVASSLGLGDAIPARLAAALVVADALAVAGAATVVGALLTALAPRLGHSALAGALMGPLLFVPVAAPYLLALRTGQVSLVASLAPLLLALALCAACGALAGLVGEILERSGRAVSGPGLWLGLAALLVVGGRAAASGGALIRVWNGQLLLAGVAGLGAALLLRSRSRRRPPRHGQWSGRGAVFAATAVLLAWWPSPDAWLFYQREARTPPARPGILLVAFEPEPEVADPFDSVAALLGRDTAAFEEVVSGPEGEIASLLTLSDGRSLWVSLEARGYDTAAVLRDPEAPLGFGARRRDARGGARRTLRESATVLTGSALLLSLGPDLLAGLRLDESVRSPNQLRRDVGGQLLRQRSRDRSSPFLLLVDARSPGDGSPPVIVETFLGDLLEMLFELGLAEDTSVVAAVLRAEGAGLPRLSVAISGPGAPAAGRWSGSIPASRVAEGLLAAADGERPPPLALGQPPARFASP